MRYASLVLLLFLAACGGTPAPSLVLDAAAGDVVAPADADGGGEPDLPTPDNVEPGELPIPDAVGPCEDGEPCTIENEWGACQGAMVCEGEAGPYCDAPAPEEEACDGVDNDCDGTVDDIACDDGDPCTSDDWCSEGLCAGTAMDCDDANPCTADSCDDTGTCLHEPLDGSLCDDEDLCTDGDHCEDDLCIGAPVDCDDGNLCTDDWCNPAEGCAHADSSEECSDGNACTVGDKCTDGECVGIEIPCDCIAGDVDACAELEDDNLCNGTLFCDTGTLPHKCAIDPASVILCPEPEGIGSECLAPACNPATGECSFIPAKEGKICDDGDGCTVGETCSDGECGSGKAVNCNDGNPCTDDSCDPATGCVHTPNTVPCEDGDPCTFGDLCADGACLPGGPTDCDDDNVCTDDWCNPAEGCAHGNSSEECSDGNACTTGDACTGGKCVATALVDCNDGNPCTDDSCDPATGCVHGNSNVKCDDGNPCTVNDQCADGACVPGKDLDCSDGNPCTDDSCHPSKGCVHKPNLLPCDDQNACTEGDVCAGGLCTSTALTDCDDDNPCTDDSCVPATGCAHAPNAAPCSDGDACTAGDLCTGGQCVPGQAVDCDDGNVCTDDWCNPAEGCAHGNSSEECDDGNACTTGDACTGGKCVPTGLLDCNDDNVCTNDACDPSAGCVHAPNAVLCNDGNACTAGDACVDGECHGLLPVDCDDGNPCTMDSCDPAAGCAHGNSNGECDDGNACTEGDLCTGGKCVPTALVKCDDGNPCTDDACDIIQGCIHTPNVAPCEDGDACTAGDTCAAGECVPGGATDCDDGNVCTHDLCDPDVGCYHMHSDVACDDGNACTLVDSCVGGVCLGDGVPDCDDGNDCTADTCKAATGCVSSPIVPCCGDSSVDGDEQCDDGPLNGSIGLGTCTEECRINSRYERVLRMDAAGQVVAGNWDDAHERVIDRAEDCFVRVDSRLLWPQHLEYTASSIRFDAHPLHAPYDTWDAYAFVEVSQGVRAGLGSNYRRGNHTIVTLKDTQQHADQDFTALSVDVYCERESLYELASAFDATGKVTEGESFAKLKERIAGSGQKCKVQYDGRLSPVDHVEVAANLIYFDFLGLHAYHDGWDSYAFVVVQENARASLAASYRRGSAYNVYLKDRSQHSEYSTQHMPVKVFCEAWVPTPFTVTAAGLFTQGDWATLKQMTDEGRECRVGFDSRVATPLYIEHEEAALSFEFERLHAPYPTWEALAQVRIQPGSLGALRTSYRRGHGSYIHQKSLVQHATVLNSPQTINVWCDSQRAPFKVLSVSAVGTATHGSFEAFHTPFTDSAEGYFCKVRVDGRTLHPLTQEYGGAASPMLFDDVALAGYHNQWDAYAGVSLTHASSALLVASYRRGHHDYVWLKDRDQYGLTVSTALPMTFLCE